MLLKNASILVVDDEPDLLDIMAEWFRREGATVFVSNNGAAALSLVQGNHLDVIVSDIHMPVMDGVTMLQKIKATRTYLPSVIFVTGFYDIAPREAYELGVEAILSKPVERKPLLSVVSRILATRDDLWCLPPADKGDAVLLANFESLSSALTRGLIAFGRGGFCIYSTLQLVEGPVDLLLDFHAEHRRVTGQGIVRWASPEESMLGVEITSIDPANLPWILSLTAPDRSLSFIPRTTCSDSARVYKAFP
jgi:two-component system, chemotaxis family, chemotaxis protein CheY